MYEDILLSHQTFDLKFLMKIKYYHIKPLIFSQMEIYIYIKLSVTTIKTIRWENKQTQSIYVHI